MVGEDARSLRDSSRRYRTARSSGLRTEGQEPMLGNLRPELEILFLACSLRCLPNTRNRSRSWNASRFGVDRMQRNFDPMRKQVEAGQRSELTSLRRLGRLEGPKHLACIVHDLYFAPKYEEFRPRTIWSLSNAFTSAFKELD